MSQIAMTILDGARAIHGQPHGSFVDSVVAALGAEPESIEDLQAALARFRSGDRRELSCWGSGQELEPYDAGLVIVDLAAKLVMIESTYSSPGPEGTIALPGRRNEDEYAFPYHLSQDWLFLSNAEQFEGLSEARRAERRAAPRTDTRAILYGQAGRFVLDRCREAGAGNGDPGTWAPPGGWFLQALPERVRTGEPPTVEDAVAEIHARWLLTPRSDLDGRSPREVLLAKRKHLDMDLQDRELQWSLAGKCPPGLDSDTAAFRRGGFGSHERILYYDLVRHLVWDCWNRLAQSQGRPLDENEETRRLARSQDDWLAEPQYEDLGGRTPQEVINSERTRIPLAMSSGEAVVDDDCPLCQMLAEDAGPVFWHLDGCNHDDDFAFSTYATRDEWEQERRRQEDLFRELDELPADPFAGNDGLVGDSCQYEDSPEHTVPDAGKPEPADGIWQRTFFAETPHRSPAEWLFGIGCCLAELGGNLKENAAASDLVPALNRQFGNLREVLSTVSPELLEPVVERFCQELGTAVELRPDLDSKCQDLERQLRELVASLQERPDEDLPF